jgi:RNA polymerase sigma-70 factor (ECF subfamily)
MIFSCCHPQISQDSQVALTLKNLCGLTIPEISQAFLSKKNLREDLCNEAIRLCKLLVSNEGLQSKDSICGLLALMLFNVDRFRARFDKENIPITLEAQDRSLWNNDQIQEAIYYMNLAMKTDQVTEYHIFAAISAQHCTAPSYEQTHWATIRKLYSNLGRLNKSPLVQLNQIIVLAQVEGPKYALCELGKLKMKDLENYLPFYTAKAELEMACQNFQEALQSVLDQKIKIILDKI